MDSSLRYWVVMSANILRAKNQKLVELLFKIFNSFGSKCYKIGSCASVNAFLIELKHSIIYRIAYKKSSIPSKDAPSHPSNNLLVVKIKSNEISLPLKI